MKTALKIILLAGASLLLSCKSSTDMAGSGAVAKKAETPTVASANGNPTISATGCMSASPILNAGENFTFQFANIVAGATYQIQVTSATGDTPGLASPLNSQGQVVFNAASQVTTTERFSVTATSSTGTSPLICYGYVQKAGDLGVPDDGIVNGLVGKVFHMPSGSSSLPDYTGLTPIDTIVTNQINVPHRDFKNGFPNVPNLVEWFTIQFTGGLKIPTAGTYGFQLTSDDGSNLYIDGKLIVNNDGVHATGSKQGSATLTQGEHTIELDYFQGPPFSITMQLFWQPPGANDFEIIGSQYFQRTK